MDSGACICAICREKATENKPLWGNTHLEPRKTAFQLTFGNSRALPLSRQRTTLLRHAKGATMYLFFIPPVCSFVIIFGITLRSEFAEHRNTNL